MIYKLVWSGLADENYYNVIAQYCIPSWTTLPGDKNIVHDSDVINIKDIKITPWDDVANKNSKFFNYIQNNYSKKVYGFWRKMQSQVWAVRKFKNTHDFVILLDTDIEVLNFNIDNFELELKKFIDSDLPWATGRSQSRLHDSGFIIFNTKHRLLDEVIDYYENIWENEKIFDLKKAYDGHAVESMFDLYPSYKIMNTDYGKGLHIYSLGFVHYGSKIPKSLRAGSKESGKDLVEKYIKDIVVKQYKN